MFSGQAVMTHDGTWQYGNTVTMDGGTWQYGDTGMCVLRVC